MTLMSACVLVFWTPDNDETLGETELTGPSKKRQGTKSSAGKFGPLAGAASAISRCFPAKGMFQHHERPAHQFVDGEISEHRRGSRGFSAHRVGIGLVPGVACTPI